MSAGRRSVFSAVHLGLAVLLTAAAATAQDTSTADEPTAGGVGRVAIELQPQEITVGDRVTAQITLVWMGEEPTAEPRFPTWQETWGGAEVLGSSPVDAFADQSARRIYRQEITLTAFEAGETRLPPVRVAIPLAERTVELASEEGAAFTVRSVLPAEADGGDPAAGDGAALEPRPAAGLVDLDDGAAFPIAAAGLAILAAVAAARLLRRSAGVGAGADRRRRPRPAPLAELEGRLDRLDPAFDAVSAHTGLSFALRDYLGRCLGFHAVESTTSEIGRQLRGGDLPRPLAMDAVGLLRDCDQVKFARASVTAATAAERIGHTRELAQRIQDAARPEPVAAPEAA